MPDQRALMYNILLVWMLISKVSGSKGIGEPHFECGDHGRFEYCIGEKTDCIIGCHCHPGYYFDTGTKICEPNAKLIQHYRRMHGTEQGLTDPQNTNLRLNKGNQESITVPLNDSPDKQADPESKDAGDLGDWLYNQFFETIESSVVNKTNAETPTDANPTRRSGGNFKTNKENKRKHKKLKSISSLSKNKLKRRLSIPRSGGSSSSSSSTSSETDSSDSSDSSNSAAQDDRDSKRLIYINKKPQPPLPSFIFLPNLQTNFFPPLGMQAPLPMYPMIPVPPVYPMPGHPPPCPPGLTGQNTACSPDPKNEGGDQKLHQMKHLRTHEFSNTRRDNGRDMDSTVTPKTIIFTEIPEYFNVFVPSTTTTTTTTETPQENVDFKYIGQLIHKGNKKSTKGNYTENRQSAIKKHVNHFLQHPELRLQNQHDKEGARHLENPDETYYSRLGKQIASLIRTADAGNNQRINIDIEPALAPPKPKEDQAMYESSQVIMQKSYAPQSLIERPVRSPLNQIPSLLNENYYDHKTYDDSLFSWEKKVEIIATTPRSLTLNDIENVLFWINSQKSNHQESTESPLTTTKNIEYRLKVNLLPYNDRVSNNEDHGSLAPKLQQSQPTSQSPIIINNSISRSENIKQLTNEYIVHKSNEIDNFGTFGKDSDINSDSPPNVQKIRPQFATSTQNDIENLQQARMSGTFLKNEQRNISVHYSLPSIEPQDSSITGKVNNQQFHVNINRLPNYNSRVQPSRYPSLRQIQLLMSTFSTPRYMQAGKYLPYSEIPSASLQLRTAKTGLNDESGVPKYAGDRQLEIQNINPRIASLLRSHRELFQIPEKTTNLRLPMTIDRSYPGKRYFHDKIPHHHRDAYKDELMYVREPHIIPPPSYFFEHDLTLDSF